MVNVEFVKPVHFVIWRPCLVRVREPHFIGRKATFSKHFIKKIARRSNKGNSFEVFSFSWGFPDNGDSRGGVTSGSDIIKSFQCERLSQRNVSTPVHRYPVSIYTDRRR